MVTCYPQPGKPKSLRLCRAFAAGAGGTVDETGELQPGASGFYGVVGIEALFRQAQNDGRDWYYMDNAHFDSVRGAYFRAARNTLQWRGGKPDWARFAKLGLGVQPWQKGGRHIVVCPQSEHFMRDVCGWPGGMLAWADDTLHRIKAATDRAIVVRHWDRDKGARLRDLQEDLRGAWALVTHMSAAANEALVAGIPVFLTGPSAALSMGSSELENIESPRRPDGRIEWAARLAGAQWSVEELAAGAAWRALHEA